MFLDQHLLNLPQQQATKLQHLNQVLLMLLNQLLPQEVQLLSQGAFEVQTSLNLQGTKLMGHLLLKKYQKSANLLLPFHLMRTSIAVATIELLLILSYVMEFRCFCSV